MSNKYTLNPLAGFVTFFVPLGLPLLCHAVDETSQSHSIRQQSQQAISQKQQAAIEAATPQSEKPQPTELKLGKNQQKKAVNNTVQQKYLAEPNIEIAIFKAINQKNHVALQQLIQAYKQNKTASHTMLLFAEAALLAIKGKVSQAIAAYQVLLKHEPNFVRARLDLAKLYYQDGLLIKAQAEFQHIKTHKKLPKAVIKNIQAYLKTIKKRQSVNATVSLGLGYARNLNESSESSTCLFRLPNGQCGYERTTPKAINSTGINYQATLKQNWHSQGHSGMTASFLAFGRAYASTAANDRDFTTLNVSAGYRYADFQREIVLAPLVELRHENKQNLYAAYGLRLGVYHALPLSWLGRPARLYVDAERKNFKYKESYQNNDGIQNSVYSTLSIQTQPQYTGSLWFLSADYINRSNQFKANAYNQAGLGVGYQKQWQNLAATVSAKRHWRKHKAKNALLNKQRKDKKYSLNVRLSSTKFAWQGFVPSLNLQYVHNNSNVDWLYDYQTSEIWLKMQKVF